MANPFKELLSQEEVPSMLKQRVLNDVSMIKLSMDMADLFMVKYPNAVGDLLSGGGSSNKKG